MENMANWYVAPSLQRLLGQVNDTWPGRDRTSDGAVGDVSHQARKSDHNPDWSAGGVVRARDFDKDGMDGMRLVNSAIRDRRVEYVIHNGLIWQRKYGFVPRKYTGVNGHYGHVHISIRHGKQFENDTSAWVLTGAVSAVGSATKTSPTVTGGAPITSLINTLSQEDELFRIIQDNGNVYAVQFGNAQTAMFKHVNEDENEALERAGVPIRHVGSRRFSQNEVDRMRHAVGTLRDAWRVS